MRGLTLALLLIAGLSGCTEADSEPEDSAPVDDVGTEYRGVLVHSSAYQAVPGLPAEFDVQLPEGAVDVQFEITVGAIPGQASVEVALSGCGATTSSWGGGTNIVITVGGQRATGDLCDSPASGPQVLSVSAGSVPMEGVINLMAHVPA